MSWLGQQQKSSKLKSITAELYSTSELSLYDQPPEAHVSIEDFEGFALDRLKGDSSQLQTNTEHTRGLSHSQPSTTLMLS
jgi:hypothetical protein